MTRTPPFLALAALLLTLAACTDAPEKPVSVLLVTPDSLRVDRLEQAPTPRFDAFAARGTVYRNAWSTSPWTAPSIVSVMSGLHPPSHGVVYRDDTTPAVLPTLPRLLAARGYRVGNFSFFSQISYFRNLGLGETVEGLLHRQVPEGFARWLGELPPDEPFFAWVHLLETHLPYGATGYRAQAAQVAGSTGLERAQVAATVPVGTVEFAPGDRERLVELYDRDVETLDRALGVVLDALDATGRRERTLVVYVADHGEELLEDGWIGHASTSQAAKLIPEILRVPLVLAGPGVPAGEVREELVQQVDILPSVLRLLDVEAPSTLDGSVLPGLKRGFFDSGFKRQAVFFDSSPGGNLTRPEDRGVRLQGAGDGGCLYVVEVRPNAPERRLDDGCDAEDVLRDALLAWRRRPSEQRLALLGGEEGGPDPALADAYEERIEILEPSAGTLEWASTRGQIVLAWEGRGEEYWLEYDAGEGLMALRGSFRLEQQRVVFGPVPQGFWNDLAGYSPFRIRLLDAVHEERSRWLVLDVRPASENG